ncbi:MAG: DUF192 domain-containing protein [Arenibacterium sp.]
MRRLFLAISIGLLSAPVWAECSDTSVELRGDWGETRFDIELADTPEERSQGLMFVPAMRADAGMLFVYERPQRAVFWMKNTLIPLDMVFTDRSGVVQHVHHNAIPGDLTGIDGGNDIFAVLEINAGLAEEFGIAPGSEMRHAVFADGPAAWPC